MASGATWNRDKRIPVAGPQITDAEVALVADAARNGWYENANAYINQFERLVADYCGVKHAIAVSHATSAIHLALETLGVTEGDEVIAPDITWIASVAPIYQTGADAVLVDMKEDTWCIDPAAIERAITPRTKAILGVDLYGSMCDWPAIEKIARERGIKVIEDAAEALGSSLDGRRAGAFGDISVLSFHGSKTVTTGEGGMLLTNDEALYRRALFLRDHGRTNVQGRYQMFFNTEIAFKYKMSAMQAALGVGQMKRIDALIEHKRNTFEWYRKRLSGLNGVSINVEPPNVFNCFWMPTIVLDPSLGVTRNDIMEGLDARGVDSRPFFTPLTDMPAFAEHKAAQRFAKANVVGARIAPYAVNLPSSALTTEDDVDYVCAAILEILREGEVAERAIAS
ncbi:MAG: DegT/DnrJ/EryC1/StrS family aminotransferase [Hyphomonadaceae bacterium]|nr:MAG: perosamine synthetase [Caulobacteraceae bacterium]MBT9446289.1 DegT/DnrJ/EryC1/StrS family aminotransferase [Hyphomonadaceae bacterium]TPW08874.1 MAG: perosamine synthetase [Alphaproteobacteria bacterium]